MTGRGRADPDEPILVKNTHNDHKMNLKRHCSIQHTIWLQMSPTSRIFDKIWKMTTFDHIKWSKVVKMTEN